MTRAPDLVAVFLRWIWWRAVLHNGWWLATSVYLVVDTDLSRLSLVVIGVVQGRRPRFEVPAGVLADDQPQVVAGRLARPRRRGDGRHGADDRLLPLVGTQMLWGLGWTFASGADIAWVAYELAEPTRISVVLMRSGRACGAASRVYADCSALRSQQASSSP